MFALSVGSAQVVATIPDVCLTPAPPSPTLVPVPYPNLSSTALANPFTLVHKVLLVGTPALNLASKLVLSNGDELGAAGGGVKSKTIKAEVRFTVGSSKVMIGGKPAVRVGALSLHNQENTLGAAVSPSQSKVMVMS